LFKFNQPKMGSLTSVQTWDDILSKCNCVPDTELTTSDDDTKKRKKFDKKTKYNDNGYEINESKKKRRRRKRRKKKRKQINSNNNDDSDASISTSISISSLSSSRESTPYVFPQNLGNVDLVKANSDNRDYNINGVRFNINNGVSTVDVISPHNRYNNNTHTPHNSTMDPPFRPMLRPKSRSLPINDYGINNGNNMGFNNENNGNNNGGYSKTPKARTSMYSSIIKTKAKSKYHRNSISYSNFGLIDPNATASQLDILVNVTSDSEEELTMKDKIEIENFKKKQKLKKKGKDSELITSSNDWKIDAIDAETEEIKKQMEIMEIQQIEGEILKTKKVTSNDEPGSIK